jgi:hypothetical protein
MLKIWYVGMLLHQYIEQDEQAVFFLLLFEDKQRDPIK